MIIHKKPLVATIAGTMLLTTIASRVLAEDAPKPQSGTQQTLTPAQIVAKYIAQEKTGVVLDDTEYRKLTDEQLFSEYLPYLKDPQEEKGVRDGIVNQFKSIALRSTNAPLRRRAVEAVLQSVLSFPTTQYQGLLAVRPSDFTPMSRALVLKLYQRTRQHPDLIRLAGAARVREIEPELRAINVRLADEPQAVDRGDNGDEGAQARSLQAAVWFALACFGDDDAVEMLLQRATVQKDLVYKGRYLAEVALTRNPQGVKLIMPFVFSEEKIAEDGNIPEWDLRSDVRKTLALVLEDFPTEREVTQPIRDYMKRYGYAASLKISVVDTRDDKVREWLAQPGYGFKVKQ